jgi:translation initiation factor 2B subunit (eIF-2B alpha/beta/delta family)
LKETIRNILEDHTSGSTEILSRLQDTLLSELSGSDSDYDSLINEYLEQSSGIESAFAVVHHFHNFLREGNINPDSLRRYADHWKNQESKLIQTVMEKVNFSGNRVLLHSNSGTVLSLFREVSNQEKLSVIQTESRPLYEGRLQAMALAEQGHEVTLIPDSAVGTFRNDFDICILGADAIFNQYFVNKIGSYAIASICHSNGNPVIVLADPRKKISDAWRFTEPTRSPKEVWKKPGEGIKVFNRYFEAVPRELTTIII